jgi:hypothetical protein
MAESNTFYKVYLGEITMPNPATSAVRPVSVKTNKKQNLKSVAGKTAHPLN